MMMFLTEIVSGSRPAACRDVSQGVHPTYFQGFYNGSYIFKITFEFALYDVSRVYVV